MKSIKFERLSGDVVLVKGTAECGQEFTVASILEPGRENPLLVLPNPLGMNGVRQILDEWKEHRS